MVPDMQVFPVLVACHFRNVDALFGLAMVENPGLAVRWNFDAICCSFWWPYRYFRLSFDVVVTCWHFLRARRGRKPQVCRLNCSDICHTVRDISTSGLDVHVAISGCPSMSHLFVDTFFEFCVIDNFVYCARATVILTLHMYSAVRVCDYDYVL